MNCWVPFKLLVAAAGGDTAIELRVWFTVTPTLVPRVVTNGTNLTVPAGVTGTDAQLNPTILMGAHQATVTGNDLVLGNDRLTVTVPNVAPGSALAVRVTVNVEPVMALLVMATLNGAYTV